MSISIGDEVKIHYLAKLQNGEIIETTLGKEPFSARIGSKNLIPGLEEALIGLKKGDKKKITVPPNKGFGERNENLLQEIPKSQIEEEGKKVSADEVIELRYEDGNRQLVTINEVKEDSIVLDLNHPLSGEVIIFDVEVIDISSN
ncbi:MAG: peptidylprolyl isomerase [Candidatus Bathyarchaeota archaeon]|nr:peptidylprolyl isomerase [Candidatus Bathyarchaeota archaeon]MCZ2845333.1 peptidylprolyl isomerase [Candidatus Bathyarchaeota archaeon]